MTDMSRPSKLSRRPDRIRHAARWWWPAVLLALTPKCVLCLLAYGGLGAALGVSGPEICGALSGSEAAVAWTSVLAWFGVAGRLGAWGWLGYIRRTSSR